MSDIDITSDNDIQTINLDLGMDDGMTLTDGDMLGIELLTDPGKQSPNKDGYTSVNNSPKSNTSNGDSPKIYVNYEENNLFSGGVDDTVTNNIDTSFNGIVNNIDNADISSNNDIPKKVLPDEEPFFNVEHKPNPVISEFQPIHTMSSQDIKNEKVDLIYKFKRLEGQGIRTTMNYNMNSPLEDMRNEFIKLKKQREVDNSIKFSRKALMACVTGIEFLNTRFDPFAIQLEGWSETVNESITDYDEIFEELSEKYTGGGKSEPEMQLLFALAGSAFMFHLQNTLFKTSLPGMSDIMKQNPELAKQFAEAAMSNNHADEPLREKRRRPSNRPIPRQEMNGSDDIDNIIDKMNLHPSNVDIDNISIMSGDSDKKSGITLNI
jgi:hypothetical protein